MITLNLVLDDTEEAREFLGRVSDEFGDPTLPNDARNICWEDSQEGLAEFLTMSIFEHKVILSIKMLVE